MQKLTETHSPKLTPSLEVKKDSVNVVPINRMEEFIKHQPPSMQQTLRSRIEKAIKLGNKTCPCCGLIEGIWRITWRNCKTKDGENKQVCQHCFVLINTLQRKGG
jgi:hypothetical protein